MTATTMRRIDAVGRAESRTAGLMAGLRSTPLFEQVVPMEATIGWPIPRRQRPGWDGRTAVYLTFPLSTYRRPERRGLPTELFPPIASLTLHWASGAPYEFVDFRLTRPWPMRTSPPVIGTFPHEAVRDLTAGDYLASRARLAVLYDGLADSLADGTAWDESSEFSALLGRLMEPCLLPYYRMLAPRFVERFLGAGTGMP